MNQIFQIFFRDLKRILHNRMALIVMIGVLLLPSIYAWFNIAANQNPYANTKNVRVAVVNLDEPATKDGFASMHIGQSILENLKKNDQLGWTVTNEADALEGVKSGKYYAAIVIPKDFSKNLLSFVDHDIEYPKIHYYVNEKKNAIAPKITESGLDTVELSMNQEFSAILSKTVTEMVDNQSQDFFARVEDKNHSLLDSLNQSVFMLESYQQSLKGWKESLEQAKPFINNIKDSTGKAKESIAQAQKTLDRSQTLLENSRVNMAQMRNWYNDLNSDLENFGDEVKSDSRRKIEENEIKFREMNAKISSSLHTLQELAALNQQMLSSIHNFNEQMDAVLLSQVSGDFMHQTADFQNSLKAVETINNSLLQGLDLTKNAYQNIDGILAEGKQDLKDMNRQYGNTVDRQLNASFDKISGLNGRMQGLLKAMLPMTDSMMSQMDQFHHSADSAADTMSKAGNAIEGMANSLRGIRDEISALQNSQLYRELEKIARQNPDKVSDFMSAPMKIETVSVYGVDTYGSSMAPFYSNLAFWVGGLVLVSILKQEVQRDEEVKKFTMRQAYFGRLLLFLSIGVLQGVIVALGDMYLLRIQCVHPLFMVLTSAFCSFVYVNIIYSLAVAFKHIGKAISVLLVILQIPGSSGTYPIEMTPVFFQRLNPWLPFNYGVNAFRETVAGIYWPNYGRDLAMLFLYLPCSLAVGLLCRRIFLRFHILFDKKLGESELMICEETPHEYVVKRDILLRLLLQGEEQKALLKERAEELESNYTRQIRRGFLWILVIPFFFLILMFSIESKLLFLMLWILSIIVISVFLIYMEYRRERLGQELEFSHLSNEEIVEILRKGEQDK